MRVSISEKFHQVGKNIEITITEPTTGIEMMVGCLIQDPWSSHSPNNIFGVGSASPKAHRVGGVLQFAKRGPISGDFRPFSTIFRQNSGQNYFRFHFSLKIRIRRGQRYRIRRTYRYHIFANFRDIVGQSSILGRFYGFSTTVVCCAKVHIGHHESRWQEPPTEPCLDKLFTDVRNRLTVSESQSWWTGIESKQRRNTLICTYVWRLCTGVECC